MQSLSPKYQGPSPESNADSENIHVFLGRVPAVSLGVPALPFDEAFGQVIFPAKNIFFYINNTMVA
jgi:hypothetical protein